MKDYKSVVPAIAFFLLVSVLGFAVPQVAILDAVLAAGIDPAAGPLITSKVEEEFVNSGKYTVLDRANIEQVLREKEFQLSSGVVRNEEVRQAGEYLGADFIVAVNVSRVGQTFVVTAKMIDVVSGEIAAQTSYERQGRVDVLLDIAKVVGGRLAGTEVVMIEVEEPKPEEAEEEEVAEAPKPEPPPRVKKEREPAEFKRFVVGVKAGGNLANVRTDTWGDWEYWDYDGGSVWLFPSDGWPYSVFGLNAGAYFSLNLNNYLGVQIEGLYSQKGYKYDFEDYDDFLMVNMGAVTNIFRFHYIEFPLLFKARWPGKISPFAVAGVSIGYLITVTVENQYADSISQSDYDSAWGDDPVDLIDQGWEYNALDLGIVGGAGVEILVGPILLNLEARYTLGLLAPSTYQEYKNGAFSFTAGAGFPF
jgi:hypothetical protein